MNRPEHHPPTVMLDKLRAGLLDDELEEKARLEAHLQACAHCRDLYSWPSAALAGQPATDIDLDRVRRQAVSATHERRRLRPLLPLAAAAALALVAVSVVNLLPQTEPEQTRVATGGETEDVPPLYEDLDFYLWLADHKTPGDSST